MFQRSLNMLMVCSRRQMCSQKSAIDWAKQEKKTLEPFEYLLKIPCKHLNMLSPAFNYWLQVPEQKLKRVQEINQAFIIWNILLDDIVDDCCHRYGMPAAHSVFGVGLTICAAELALIQIRKEIDELGDPLGSEILTKRLHEFTLGQALDLYWRDNHVYPSEETHIEMSKAKSGACFKIPVELLQLFSSDKTDYTHLATNIAVYYELLDDYYNLFHPRALARLATVKQENYKTNSDITEGKITLAVIHASQFTDVATELADILKQRTRDPKLQNRVIYLLKKHGSDEYVREKLRKLEHDIRTEMDHLGGNPTLAAFMDDLSFESHSREPDQLLYS